jgi:3-dehydroquinate dehydratase/shikimate dehydrogenase
MRPGALCLTLTPASLDEVFAADLSRVDAVEIRLDYLPDPRQSSAVRWDRLPVPVIATCRGKERGGKFAGSAEDEIAILAAAAGNGARFVDLDYRIARGVSGATVIASFHDFSQTPEDLQAVMKRVAAAEAGIAKIATQVNSWADNRRLLDLLSRDWGKPVIALGMGEIGQITRLVGPARGSLLTFAAAAAERQAAPGQLTVDEMLDVYKFRRIGAGTKLLGILGMPVGHSQSPVIHNRAFEVAGVDFAYAKLPAPSVEDFMANARGIGIHGCSVTIPHKVSIMPFLDRLEPAASKAGAVNTVTARDGRWVGDNTDVHGVRAALESVGFDPADKTVVILGRGGAAKAAVAALEGARSVALVTRDEMSRAGQRECDLLINATPVGMWPHVDVSPVEGPIRADVVFDMIYNPQSTKLLRSAASEGRTIVSGRVMFMAQAARQFEIWTGQPAPAEVFGSK